MTSTPQWAAYCAHVRTAEVRHVGPHGSRAICLDCGRIISDVEPQMKEKP